MYNKISWNFLSPLHFVQYMLRVLEKVENFLSVSGLPNDQRDWLSQDILSLTRLLYVHVL